MRQLLYDFEKFFDLKFNLSATDLQSTKELQIKQDGSSEQQLIMIRVDFCCFFLSLFLLAHANGKKIFVTIERFFLLVYSKSPLMVF